MKQGPPRLQHYVPQLLLRQFAGADGKLWAYDVENRRMFASNPKGLASEGFFYGGTGKHATRGSTAIESWLAQEIERPGADAIAQLLARRQLSIEQMQAFLKFVATQMYRTPASLQRTSDCFAPSFQETAERIAKHVPEVRENIIADIKATGATEQDVSQMLQILNEGKFTVTPTREFALYMAFSNLELVANELRKMRWEFGSVPQSDCDLILGDHPVTLADVAGENAPAKPLGLRNPTIEIAMPLSSRMVALAHWDGPIRYGELAPGVADAINERTLRQIHRFAFASFESKDLLKRAIALRGTGPKMRTRRLQKGEKLLMWTEFS